MPKMFTADDLDAMQLVRCAFDPAGHLQSRQGLSDAAAVRRGARALSRSIRSSAPAWPSASDGAASCVRTGRCRRASRADARRCGADGEGLASSPIAAPAPKHRVARDRPRDADVVLSTTRPERGRSITYAGDLVATVPAGAHARRGQRRAARASGQWLPLDPPARRSRHDRRHRRHQRQRPAAASVRHAARSHHRHRDRAGRRTRRQGRRPRRQERRRLRSVAAALRIVRQPRRDHERDVQAGAAAAGVAHGRGDRSTTRRLARDWRSRSPPRRSRRRRSSSQSPPPRLLDPVRDDAERPPSSRPRAARRCCARRGAATDDRLRARPKRDAVARARAPHLATRRHASSKLSRPADRRRRMLSLVERRRARPRRRLVARSGRAALGVLLRAARRRRRRGTAAHRRRAARRAAAATSAARAGAASAPRGRRATARTHVAVDAATPLPLMRAVKARFDPQRHAQPWPRTLEP